MRRIFIDHGEAYGNLGDEAMLTSALRRLSEALGPVTFVVPREGTRPLPAFDGYTVETVPSPFMAFIRQGEAAKATRFFAPVLRQAGGDVLTAVAWFAEFNARTGRLAKSDPEFAAFEKGLMGCDAFYGVGAADFNEFNAQGAVYKLWLYRLAKRRVPLVVVAAQGFGPLSSPRWASVAKRGFEALDILTFRDHSFSRDFCAALGLKGPETKVVQDEAFSLPPADPAIVDAALEQAGLKPNESFVAVHWRGTDYTQTTDRFLPRVAAAFDIAASSGLKLLFVPMSYDEHSGHDAELVAALRELMREKERLLCLPVQTDVRVNKSAIGRARYTLGLSYHVHIFGLSQGLPAVILSTGEYYRYKSEGLVAFYGPPNAAVDLATANDAALNATIRAVADHAPALRPAVEAVNARIATDNDWTIRRMAEKLGALGR